MICDGIRYTQFSALCENLRMTFIDGLKIFVPNNKYVQQVDSDLNLEITNLNLNIPNINNLLPHQMKINDDQKYLIEDIYNSKVLNPVKVKLKRRYEIFGYEKRIKLGIYNNTVHDFLGVITKYTQLEHMTILCLNEIAMTSNPANILASHVWIRFPSKFPRPDTLLGKPNKFRGRIYSYIKYDEYRNLEMTDYSIKPIER